MAAKKGSNDTNGESRPNDHSPSGSPDSKVEDNRPTRRFPIVGLGASAGGLGALEEFFEHVPQGSGAAFVVVTHQRPGQPSLLPEILGRKIDVPVMEVSQATRVEPNHLYTSAPGHNLSIANGVLHPVPVDKRASPHLPVDYFFRSLAQDQKEWAIAIILSGTGSDGTLGLKEIKGELGMVMVQEEASATYSGMPHSAIATQLVDFVLPAAEMPEQLMRYARSLEEGRPPPAARSGPPPETMQQIFILIRARTGHDFAHYKPSTIGRRVERRMVVRHVESAHEYVRYLQANPTEVDLLFKELLIGVTSFFRDREAWEALRPVLSNLLADKPDSYLLRAWVPGCSTGEEAYSLAILMRECMDAAKRTLNVQIFATDLDPEAIDVARAGAYPAGIANDLSPQRLARFFTQEGEVYRVGKEIREMVVFAPQNVITDPPFTKLDLLSCRNLLIYLDASMQRRLFPIFHYALRDGGILFLGSSESVGAHDKLFSSLDKKWKLYRRKEVPPGTYVTEFPAVPPDLVSSGSHGRGGARAGWTGNVDQLAERMLLKELVPPTVLVNDRGDVVHVHGRTGLFLEPAQGSQSAANVFNMAREGLQIRLSTALRQASTSGEEIVHGGVKVRTNGDEILLDLRVFRLKQPEPLRGLYRITFDHVRPIPRDGETPGRADRPPDRVADLEIELRNVRGNHQATIEELETANEELKSMNEELQSTNEELQSANEELGTSREEMQSLNEELQTVNAELQNKVEQLSHTNDDMKNLLNATDIATVFVDDELKIKRYTERARTVFRLIPTDVGRPLSDLASTLHCDSLIDDAREVLRTLVHKEAEIAGQGGSHYLMRILPYRTADNVIEGLVLTFVDITKVQALQEAQARLLKALEGSPISIFGQNDELRITWACRWVFGREPEDVLGKSDEDLFSDSDAARVIDAKKKVLATELPATERVRMIVDGNAKTYDLFIAPTRSATGSGRGVSCVGIEHPGKGGGSP